MLRASDLPPEVLDRHALSAPRDLYWADRSELRDVVAATEADADDDEDKRAEKAEALDRIWIKENITARARFPCTPSDVRNRFSRRVS